MIEKYGVNQFKFDGTGNANEVIKGSEFDSDFDAAIHLIGELRAKKPDLYVNLTTGTYPSPFWLLYADSIWRGGDDHSFAGVGTNRQRWITYRDSQIYRWVVEEGPLFPMNSLMLHGLIYARLCANDWAAILATIFPTKFTRTSAPERSCRRCTSLLRCSPRRTGMFWPRRRSGRATMRRR